MPRRPRRRKVRAYRRRLESYDPDERTYAATALVKRGLTRRTAGVLARHLEHDEDPRLRFTIALAVARNNGGRSRRRRVRQLRRWAAAELVDHGHPVHQGLAQQRNRRRPVLSWQPALPAPSPAPPA
jgi:hypothetical protein